MPGWAALIRKIGAFEAPSASILVKGKTMKRNYVPALVLCLLAVQLVSRSAHAYPIHFLVTGPEGKKVEIRADIRSEKDDQQQLEDLGRLHI